MQPADLKYLYEISNGLRDLLPEVFLCLLVILLIVVSLFKTGKHTIHFIALGGTIVHLALSFLAVQAVSSGPLVITDMLSVDPISLWFKVMISIAAVLTILMTRQQHMEHYVLLIAILFGAGLLVMSVHYIMVLLSIEIISISSYILVAGSGPDKRRAEAAWKFFIYGSAATATMIFGMSYLFGASGYLRMPGHFTGADGIVIAVGGLMTFAGLFFKITAAPFHLWAPDVYEATPSSVVAYLSVVPKLAGLVVVMRLVASFPTQPVDWTMVIAGFAMLSIVVGTLAALAQKDAKRMMAYSTIAHTGFLLTALASFVFASTDAVYTIGFYGLVFLVMNYVVFMVIQVKEENGGSVLYEDFSGLGYRAIIPALATTIALVSLAGLPPVAGFTSKLLVFSALWTKYASTGGFVFLALFVIGLVATVASLFFYLRIPFFLFFRQSEEKEPLKISGFTNFLLLFLVGFLFALFLFPSLFDWLGGWVIKVNFVL